VARRSPNGPSSDADVLAAAVLAPAAAFATQPLLRAIAGGPELGTLTSQLAPLQTLDRLWVVFILIPATIAFVGIGVPYTFRLLLAALRGRLEREDAITVISLAAAAALVIADLVLARSGIVPLVLTCGVAVWRARASLARLVGGAAPTLLAIAGSTLLGLAYYQKSMQGGAAASVAIAPTLVVVFFYAVLIGSLGALLAGTVPGTKASDASPRRQCAIGGGALAGAAAWILGSRIAYGATASSETGAGVEMALTVALGFALVAFAWALRALASSKTEGDAFR
jgi:hypothetical protein